MTGGGSVAGAGGSAANTVTQGTTSFSNVIFTDRMKFYGPDGEFGVATVPPETVASPDEEIVVTGSRFTISKKTLDTALVANAAYYRGQTRAGDAVRLKGKKLFAETGLNDKDLFIGNTGFKAVVYKLDDKYILGFAGTEDAFSKFPFVGNDGQADKDAILGNLSEQHKRAVDVATILVKKVALAMFG